jgi:hypothetical protein
MKHREVTGREDDRTKLGLIHWLQHHPRLILGGVAPGVTLAVIEAIIASAPFTLLGNE